MRNLIKRIIDLMIRKNWLNVINKELNRCNHYRSEYQKSNEVLHALVEQYNEIYNSGLEVKRDD